MRATRAAARRRTGPRKRVRAAATRRAAKPPVKAGAAPPQQVLFRMCKPGWGVIVEKIPNAQGTRFVCPFCPRSHRVSGPVRGFRKMRRAQWVKLRRVEE